MKYARLYAILLLSCLAISAARAQRDFSNVEIKVVPVAGNIYMLEGAGGNIGVSVGDDGILIVDDQFAQLADKIEAALTDLNPGKLKFVLNTHFHGDHIGGNQRFGEKGATIVAQENVRKRLAADEKNEKAALPVITFKNAVSVHFNGDDIELLHHGPGHTDGDSIIHFPGANVVHMGDLFFNGRFPYIDLGSGGSVDGYMETIDEVLNEMPDGARIIPGHGTLASVDDLQAYRAMLDETVEIVRSAIEDGKSLDEIKAAGLPEKWRVWGSGFITTDRWIETIYNGTTNP